MNFDEIEFEIVKRNRCGRVSNDFFGAKIKIGKGDRLSITTYKTGFEELTSFRVDFYLSKCRKILKIVKNKEGSHMFNKTKVTNILPGALNDLAQGNYLTRVSDDKNSIIIYRND